MRSGPLFAWGTDAGRPGDPTAPGGNPPQAALEGVDAPGGSPRGPAGGRGRPGTAKRAFQPADEGGIGAAYTAGAQVARQFDRAVADAQQAAHLETYRAPQPAHLAVAPLVHHDAQDAVAAARALLVRACGGA